MNGLFHHKKYNQLSLELFDMFDWDSSNKALKKAERAASQATRFHGAESKEYAQALSHVALCHIELQQYEKAEVAAGKAHFRLKRLLGKDNPEIADFINSLAEAYLYRDQFSLAEPYNVEALSLLDDKEENLQLALAYRNKAVILRERNEFDEAGDIFSRVMEIRQKTLGPKNIEVCQCFEDMTILNQRRQSHEEAVIAAEYVVSMNETLFPSASDEVINAKFFFGDAHYQAGNSKKAINTLEDAYSIARKALGSDDPLTVDIRFKLSQALDIGQKFDEAATHYDHGISALKRIMGGDHRLVIKPITDFGLFYIARGEYEKGEFQLIRAFETAGVAILLKKESAILMNKEQIDDDLFDENDAWDVLYSKAAGNFQDLAAPAAGLLDLWAELGKKEAHETFLEHLVTIAEHHIDRQNDSYPMALSIIAKGRMQAGEYDESFELFGKAHSVCRELFGSESVEALNALNEVAVIMSYVKKFDDATTLFSYLTKRRERFTIKQAPFSRKKKISTTQPLMVFRFEQAKAAHCLRQGKAEQADIILFGLLQALGDYALYRIKNEDALRHELGRAYALSGKTQKAKIELEKALALRENRLGPFNLHVADTCHELAKVFMSLRWPGVAEKNFVKAYTIKEKSLSKNHESLERSVTALGQYYFGEKRFSDATPLLEQAVEIRKKRLGSDHKSLPTALNRLANCLVSSGNTEDAEKLLLDALDIHDTEFGKDDSRTITQVRAVVEFYHLCGDEAKAGKYIERLASA